MYFYKEIRKKEEVLAKQLSEWCTDDYDCFVQKYLLRKYYFYSSVYSFNTGDEYHRPFVHACSYAKVDLRARNLFIFPKMEYSFLFDDERIESKESNVDIINKLKEGKQNWFVWIIPNNFVYKDELQQYVDSYNGTENIHAKIVFWEDLLDEYAKNGKPWAAEKEFKLTCEQVSHSVRRIKKFFPALNEMKELLITYNSFAYNPFNSSLSLIFRHPDNQSVLELIMNRVEENLDDPVEKELNGQIKEIKDAQKILLVIDDDTEGKAIKDSVIKYFRKNHPTMITEKKIEYITFPKYFIEGNGFCTGNAADSVQELEKIIETWSLDTKVDSMKIRKEIKTLEEMGSYAEVYIAECFGGNKHRKIVE